MSKGPLRRRGGFMAGAFYAFMEYPVSLWYQIPKCLQASKLKFPENSQKWREKVRGGRWIHQTFKAIEKGESYK